MLIHGVIASSYPAVSGAFGSIATATGTGSSGTITFTSIPSTYKHLQLRIIGNDGAGNQAIMRINNDSGTNYSAHRLYGTGTSASANAYTSYDSIPWVSYGVSDANIYSASIIDIHDYSSSTKNKTVRTFLGIDTNGSSQSLIFLNSGLWMNTNAINRIDILNTSGNWTTSSKFALYGIKGA